MFTGPVSTTATIPLGGAPKKGASHTFTTAAGNLVVTLDSAGTNTGALKSTTTWPVRLHHGKARPWTGPRAPASSRARPAAARQWSLGDLPKLSNGKCNESQNAQPSAKTGIGTFTATITLTLKQ